MKLFIVSFLLMSSLQLSAQDILSVSLSSKSSLIKENRSYQWCIDKRASGEQENEVVDRSFLKDGASIRISGKLKMVYNEIDFPTDTLVLMPGITDSNKLFIRTINIRLEKRDTADIYLSLTNHTSKTLIDDVFKIEIDSVRVLHKKDTFYRKCVFFCFITDRKGTFLADAKNVEGMNKSFSFCLVSNIYLDGYFEHKNSKYLINLIIGPRVGELFNDKISRKWHASDIVKIYRINEQMKNTVLMDQPLGEYFESSTAELLFFENNNIKYSIKDIDFDALTLKIVATQKIFIPPLLKN